MKAQQLIEELKVKKEKASFWQKWWIQRIIDFLEKLIIEMVNKKSDKK